MARSHPPTLLTLVERSLREECGVVAGDSIVVGVSGGPDSQALLHVLALLRQKLGGFDVLAHGVDHGLRPEAPAELELAQSLSERLQVPFARTQVVVAPGANLQARAREARYAALWQAVRAADATWA